MKTSENINEIVETLLTATETFGERAKLDAVQILKLVQWLMVVQQSVLTMEKTIELMRSADENQSGS